MRYAIIVLSVAVHGIAHAQDAQPQAARDVLIKYCVECHGQRRDSDPHFDVRDWRYLTRNGTDLIIRGKAHESRIIKRIISGEMPAEGRPRPTDEELQVVMDWINSGATTWDASDDALGRTVARTRVLPDYVSRAIEHDQRDAGGQEAADHRYLHFLGLHNAGASEEDLHIASRALEKAINCVSLGPDLVAPQPLDKLRLVYRIRLRDYAWRSSDWDLVRQNYPYGGARGDRRVMRADWFVVNILQAPLYYQLLGIPQTEQQFERGLMLTGPAERAGITDSQTSIHHRILERRDSEHGSYWKSYNRLSRWNVQRAAGSREYDYAESFFTLPNGLPGWVTFVRGGNRSNLVPTSASIDPDRASGSFTVVPAISCIACHTTFIQPNVRDVVAGLHQAYPGQARIDELLEVDRAEYAKVLRDNPEPISKLAERFNRDLTLEVAAAEVAATPDELFDAILRHSELRELGLRPLVMDRTVNRSTWQSRSAGSGVIPVVRAAELVGVRP